MWWLFVIFVVSFASFGLFKQTCVMPWRRPTFVEFENYDFGIDWNFLVNEIVCLLPYVV